MNSVVKKTVYDQVVDVTYEFLGPAAERFVAREVEAHLHKKPQDLNFDDISKLHEWSKLAIALLADDTKLVEEYSKNLLSITKKRDS
jgi:hypothetical protein